MAQNNYNLLDEDEFELVSPQDIFPAQEGPETGADTLIRNLLRGRERVGESLRGTPGDITQGLLSLGNIASEKLTGYRPLPEETFLPTSESVRKTGEQARQELSPSFAEHFQPQSQTEANVDEFLTDLTSFLHPIGGPITKPRALLGIGSTALGHLAQLGAQKLDLSEPWQKGIKVGTMLLSSLWGQKKLEDIAANYFNTAEELKPVGRSIRPSGSEGILDKMRARASRKVETPTRDFFKDRLKELEGLTEPSGTEAFTRGLMDRNNIDAGDAFDWIRDMNELYSANKIPDQAKPLIEELKKSFSQGINTLKESNTEFVTGFNEGRDIYRTLRTSSKVNEFVQDIAKKGMQLSPLSLLFFNPIKSVGAFIGSLGTSVLGNTLDRFLRSSAVKRAYFDIVSSAAQGKAGPTARALRTFDKAITKIAPKELTTDEYELI